MTYLKTKDTIMNWRDNHKEEYNEYMKKYMKDRYLNYGIRKEPEAYNAYMKEYMRKRRLEKKLRKIESLKNQVNLQKIETMVFLFIYKFFIIKTMWNRNT